MELSLTWDLLVIVFFAVVVAYSFIVGKDESVKIIISSYIAIVAVQAIGNLLSVFSADANSIVEMLGFGLERDAVSMVKLVLFIAMIIFLAIKGGFEMQYAKDLPGAWDPVVTAAFGFATAGLLQVALLTYIAARPLLDTSLGSAPLLQPLLRESTFVQAMVDYQNVWFCLPALLLLVVGFLSSRNEV